MQEYSVRHVAIIPDGNRRWAKARGKAPWLGHKEGIKTYEQVLKKALDLNIYCLSFWGMSVDNIEKREPREVKFLLGYFARNFIKALRSKELAKHDVRVSILGEWRKRFPRMLARLAERLITETKERKRHIINLLLCYDGKTEMEEAFRKAQVSKKPNTSPKNFLLTSSLPPVDLVIRTGGDPHLSAGFMMWDTADAQLHFSNKLWPDFTPQDFEKAIKDFLSRERRFGA
ncbi:MAG: di-trans,poly-cis-decaprenylcistransferase [Candidatus Ryanbacteria bacterium]|nr:di-trans,poly-cis-decaprenylcistransferase [Candidatus Ryanbacteria bacterium]